MSLNRSKILSALGAVAAITMVSATSIAALTELTVSNVTELYNAVNTANASGGDFNINLGAGTYTLTGSPLTLDMQLTGTVRFVGAGRDSTTIDGNRGSGVLKLFHRNFELANLTIQNGNSGSGGGILHYSGSAILNNVTVRNNTATYGGGIQSYSSGANQLELHNSAVSDNDALSFGAGIYMSRGNLVLDGSTVSGNQTSGSGGGIYMFLFSEATITNSTVDNNEADGGTAGIYCSQSKLNMVNSTVSNNRTGTLVSGNAGIYASQSTVNIASSTITNNTAPAGGGGIWIPNSPLAHSTTIKNTILSSNTAPDCFGTINSVEYSLIENVSVCTIEISTGNITGVPALLGPLVDNGRPTRTLLPLENSPIIDAGNPAGCTDNAGAAIPTDQRGFGRVVAARGSGIARCDIGAVEVGCGDGVVESFLGEVCDIAMAAGGVGACPASCNDENACTTDTLTDAGTCQAACSFQPITACTGSDGCCPAGCNNTNDTDCSPACGNGVVEAGEVCDGACPASCNDENACTTDTLTNAGTCQAACSFQPITACTGSDGCCPTGCNNLNDSDCPAVETPPTTTEQPPPQTPPSEGSETDRPAVTEGGGTDAGTDAGTGASAGCSVVSTLASASGLAGWLGLVIPIALIAVRRRMSI